MCQRSRLGSPSTIHSATTLPIPPAPASPWAQKPAQTKKPATSDSPRQNSLSGVKASGPLISLVTVISDIAGTRRSRVAGDLLEAVPVLFQQAAVEVGRDRLEAAGPVGQEGRFALALVAAHHQAVAVLAVVDEEVGIAQGGQVARAPSPEPRASRTASSGWVTRYWWDIGSSGTRTPAIRRDLGGEHAARVDHHLGGDVAALGPHPAHPPVAHLDPGHPGVGEDPAAAAPRPVGQRVGQLRGVDVAVGRQPGRAEHALGRHQREELLRLVGRDQLQRQPEGLRPARLPAQLLHPLLGRGEPDPAAFGPARVEVGLLPDPPVEVDRVHHHLGQRDRAAQLPDQPGRVEGRAGGELVAVDEDDVVPAQLGEVVGERGAADAAADDHAAGRVGELSARHLASSSWASNSGAVDRRQQAVEVLVRVVLEIEVEVGDRLLHDPPHRLAEVGHQPHQAQRGEVGGGRRGAQVSAQEGPPPRPGRARC